jgi:anti-sigma factor RsiW
MSCAELRTRADAYARGSLSAPESAALEAHLTTCASCAAFLEAAEAPPEQTAGLPRSVDPELDLWPGIQKRLGQSGAGRGRVAIRGWQLAAAALLLIALSSGVTALLLRRSAGGSAMQQALALTPLEAQYASAAAELAGALERARSQLAPQTIAIIERNLAVIDSALAESRRALAGDPHNAMLEQLVIAAWRQKMDFLRRATALSPAS